MDELRRKITQGIGMHKLAVQLIEESRPHTNIYRMVAALRLQNLCRMPFENAVAIITEMDGTSGGEIAIDT